MFFTRAKSWTIETASAGMCRSYRDVESEAISQNPFGPELLRDARIEGGAMV